MAQFFDHFKTGKVGHLNIQENKIGIQLLYFLNSFSPIAGFSYYCLLYQHIPATGFSSAFLRRFIIYHDGFKQLVHFSSVFEYE